ncbi:MAG TPA: MFS transporter [Tepidisphaeraceae bacterium]|jgi:nucleoside transporter
MGEARRYTFPLSVMMFLQYAVWGVWLPILANYLMGPKDQGGLGFTGAQVGWILGLAASIGAISAPFLAGQIADRFINAEKYLAILLIGGGVVKYITASVHDYHTFILLSIAYSVLYMPTLALTNSIAFAHLNNPERQFPAVRVWGTLGWIVAENAFPLLWLQTGLHLTILPPFIEGVDKANATALLGDSLRVAGVLAIAYGIWAAFALPPTPPTRNQKNPFAFARAFGLLKHRGFLVVTLVSLPIAMIHQIYFIRGAPFIRALGFAQSHVGPILSIGQISEIFFLAILGFLLASLGYKWTLVLGAFAYAARFALFAIATPETRWIVLAANALHGLCYGCFFAGAFIYVERVATADIRHSAQTVFGIIILGVGPVLAGGYNQWLDKLQIATLAGPVFDYRTFWFVQAGVAALSMLALIILFRPGLSGATFPQKDQPG